MLESLTTLAETATVAGATATTGVTAVKLERDNDGELQNIVINKKRTIIGTTLGSAATTATGVYHEVNERNVLAEVNAAQAYVESMSEEELEQTLIALNALEPKKIESVNTTKK